MKPELIVSHGFNDASEGADNIDLSIPKLSQYYSVREADYRYMNRVRVRLCNKNLSKLMAGMTHPGSVGVGYSNGCTIMWQAAVYGAPFKHLILVAPALDSDFEVPIQVDRVDVIYNPTDIATFAARFIPLSPWGSAGNKGYTGKDGRVFSHNAHELFGVKGHGGFWKYQHSADFILKLLGDIPWSG